MDAGALDVGYPSEAAFRADCAECGADADALLASGEYRILADGWVAAADWEWDHV